MVGARSPWFCKVCWTPVGTQDGERVNCGFRPEPPRVGSIRIELGLVCGQRGVGRERSGTVPGWSLLLDRETELARADLVAAYDVVLVVAWVAEPVSLGVLVVVSSDPKAAAVKGKSGLHVG